MSIRFAVPILLAAQIVCHAQYATLRGAPSVQLPEVIDGNTSSVWVDGQFHIFHSSGIPTRSTGPDQFSLGGTENIEFITDSHKPVWFEAVWRDEDGTLFFWYHHEPGGLCEGNNLTAPKIGAAVSYDNGKTIYDLGIVLESGEPMNCNAKNGFFGGGHGDFSVIPDRDKTYFYFFFTNYGGPVEEQGVAVARLPFSERFNPVGMVNKYFQGEWNEPGLGGHMSPVFPAAVGWENEDAGSYWGPSIHWNSHLEQYVILMNQVCCTPGWPQVGIYHAFSDNLADPSSWTDPSLLVPVWFLPHLPGYYPQVLGLQPGETDTEAGRVARLYVHGYSNWEVVFTRRPPMPDPLIPCAEATLPACSPPE